MSVYEGHGVTLHHGDCLDVLRSLPDCSVDSVVCDPPYNLTAGKKGGTGAASVNLESPYGRSRIGTGNGSGGFMGKAWDDYDHFPGGFYGWCEAWATECLRVLKPGGHLLAFGGTRTWHRLACAVEDAGFEVRDSIAWLYGSGFPKSLDVGKAIDKAAGVERTEGAREWSGGQRRAGVMGDNLGTQTLTKYDTPATPDAERWQGWGTALKPAFEPIVVARKPLAGTVAANVLAWGTGALNIDGCRVEGEPWKAHSATGLGKVKFFTEGETPVIDKEPHTAGRWPANVVLDETQAEALDEQSGDTTRYFQAPRQGDGKSIDGSVFGQHAGDGIGYNDTGGASRYFYVAKADASERPRVNGTAHPTVKPLALMRWLVRLVTPPGGTVLEPFAGSGTTVEACIVEGFQCIAIEREADYLPLIRQRIDRRRDPVEALRGQAADLGLFDLLGGEGA